MKLIVLDDYRKLAKGQRIAVLPNKVNFWVGGNGTGKSTLASLIITELNKQCPALIPKHWWMALNVDRTTHLELVEHENIKGVTFVSDKLRQSQHVDMDALISQGVGRIWASEGQNSAQDFVEAVKYIDDPDHLFIFDEIDGHLDYASKILFFDRFLKKVAGTVIAVTHDSHFLIGEEVYDFTDHKRKSGNAFYAEQRERFTKK